MRDRLVRWRRLAVVDIEPLRSVAGFRWLSAGSFATQAGRQLTIVAVPFQVFELTGSILAVGLLGLAQLAPLLAVALIGGALADALPRRKLLIVSSVALAATAGGLMFNALSPHPAVWLLYALTAINAGVSAIDSPARHALLPGLVGRDLFPQSMALNATLSNVAGTVFPAIAGLLIAHTGLASTFAIAMMLFLLGAVLVRGIPEPASEEGGRPFGFSAIVEGFSFLRNQRVIQAALLIDLNAMVFGMPTALFPAIGTEVLGGDASTVGLLYAAPAGGALLAAITSGWVSQVRRQGRAVVIAVIGWGISITVFGLTTSLLVALIALGFAGGADVISAIFRNSIIQLSVPDELRGRLSSMHVAVASGGPHLGDVEAGFVAAISSVRFSVVSGGIACVFGALAIAKWAPQFGRYRYERSDDAPRPPPDDGMAIG